MKTVDRYEIEEVNFKKSVVVAFAVDPTQTIVINSFDEIGTMYLPNESTYMVVPRP